MNVADLLARRSIRKYTDEPIRADQLQAALEAAMAAPSAMHCDPWRFIVIESQADRDRLADA